MRHIFLILISLFSLPAYAASYPMPNPGDDLIGHIQLYIAKKGDNLTQIARQFDLAPSKVTAANPKLVKRGLRIGDTVVLPTRFILPEYREGIVVNLAELRLYYFDYKENRVYTYPVAVGRAGWRTPTLITEVIRKKKNPTWRVPRSIHNYTLRTKGIHLSAKIGPGPDNPLGTRALYLGKPGYLIHGNNKPKSIGTYASSGCIRMYNNDVEQLFKLTHKGVIVHLVHHANKAGWHQGQLYLESHKPMMKIKAKDDPLRHTDAQSEVKEVNAKQRASVNWRKVQQVANAKRGIPIQVARSQRTHVMAQPYSAKLGRAS